MTTADRIQKLIGNMTQKAFARKAKISEVSLSRYLAGSSLSRANAEKIAQAGGVSIDWLLGRAEQKTGMVAEPPATWLTPRQKRMAAIFEELLDTNDDEILNHLERQHKLILDLMRRREGKE